MISRQLAPFGIRLFDCLRNNSSGLALTEFAFALPILMMLMASGLELANYVMTTKRMGDLAVLVADNAARMGTRGTLNINQISEAEINDVFIGATLQSGNMDIQTHGRIILSSLQRNADGGQWIAWQRCLGGLDVDSAYGQEGEGATGTSFPGMGPSDRRIEAATGSAVMVVEVSYEYQPAVGLIALPSTRMTELAAFIVREARDLTATPRNPEGVAVSQCD